MVGYSTKTYIHFCARVDHKLLNIYRRWNATYCVRFQSLTYLLTPSSRVLLEKLTGSAASQEIPRIFGTRRFITVLTSARHLCLS